MNFADSILFSVKENAHTEGGNSALNNQPAGNSLKPRHNRRLGHDLWKHRALLLMLFPAVAYVVIFNYIPMSGIVIAFKDYNYSKGIFGSDWCGFNNFKFFFQSGAASRVTLHTVLYNVGFMVFDVIFQISTAIFLSEIIGKWFKKVSQTLLLMPYFVSWVVAGAILLSLLGYERGLFNNVLSSLGFEKGNFTTDPKYWPYIFIIFHIWKGLGYGGVVYLAAISGIDQELYDAAEVDGASIFKRIWYVTLPCLKPTVVILILLSLGHIVRGDFGMFWNLTGNNPLLYSVSDIVDTYVYRSMIQTQDFGMSAAAGLYQSVLGFAVILSVNALIKKLQPEYVLF